MSEVFDGSRIRLLLLHGHGLFRESLARLLAAETGLELVAERGSFVDAMEVLGESAVDLILLDFKVNQEDGRDFIRAAREAGYQGKFLVVTSKLDAESCASVLLLGVSGIFLETSSSARLIQAIRMVASGEIWVDQTVIQVLAERSSKTPDQPLHVNGLTDRQHAVLRGVVEGLTNRKIGDSLGLSEGSIKSILQQLFVKTGVRTRSQLVRAALNQGSGQIL